MSDDLILSLTARVSALIEGLGYELFHFQVKRLPSREWRVELFADKPLGGITIEECAQLNRRLMKDMEDWEKSMGPFSVEVSSPGLDWPMRTRKDFRRQLHRRARFFLAEPIHGKIEWAGTIEGVDNDHVLVAWDQPAGRGGKVLPPVEVAVPYDKIRKAVQLIEEG